jgi:hypothetical protein
VALVYFDSSAPVKLVLDEVGSDIVAALWNACYVALSSRLAYHRGLRGTRGRRPQPRPDRVGGVGGFL